MTIKTIFECGGCLKKEDGNLRSLGSCLSLAKAMGLALMLRTKFQTWPQRGG